METELQLIEECAIEVVDSITQLIDALRSEFPLKAPTARNKQNDEIPCALYSRLKEKGFLDQMRKTLLRQEEKMGKNKFSTGSTTKNNHIERTQVVYDILLPLIQSLAHCYDALDRLQPNETQQTKISEKSIHRKEKPKPPIGMLSIQNYTDIACLLEFTVLTSFLPLIEKNILISVEDRIRYQLPKSLAGRISRSCLAWGSIQYQMESSASQKSQELMDTASTITSLVTLDRFRPMLLPRHLADIYAGLFQAEQLRGAIPDQNMDSIYANLGLTSLMKMDASVQAKAYQTLLLQGTKSPNWLRHRVSPLLAQLACKNLAAIISVFCPVQDSSTASQRLGRALATAPTKALCQQILGLLHFIYPIKGEIPARAMAILETIWAVLNQWPSETIQKHLIKVWERALSCEDKDNKYTIHATIRQIGALCSFVPPSTNPMKVFEWIPKSSIFCQLVRIASMSSVLESRAKNDAQQTLVWLSEAVSVVQQKTNVGSHQVTGQTLLVTAWVHTLIPSPWDLAGSKYVSDSTKYDLSSKSNPQSLEALSIHQDENSIIDLQVISESTSKQADVFFECTNFLSQKSSKPDLNVTGLHSKMFQLLLRLYLSSSKYKYQFASMLVLPRLVETCLPEELLFGDTDDAMSFLGLVKVILSSIELRWRNQSASPGVSRKEMHDDSGMIGCLMELDKISNRDDQTNEISSVLPESNDEQDESMLSIASIILSVLISVLELGSRLRSTQEEEALKSFLPILSSLAELNDQTTKLNIMPFQESLSGISDMSGYAMALIASRSAAPQSSKSEVSAPLTMKEKLDQIVSEAENDLRSSEPPIRARGMVTLGRLARGYLGILTEENLSRENAVPLIKEIQEDSKIDEYDPIAFLTQEVLRLSMIALSDKESYVYLAAVQAVVAVGDVRSQEVLPFVASTVVTGVLRAGTSITLTLSSDIQVSQEQRIKLAEALIFMIRRRAVVDELVPLILGLMTFGSVQRMGSKFNTGAPDDLFQEETHKYFLGEDHKDGQDDDELESNAEKWEKRDIRLKTGGPIFKEEEFDLVRGARASVLAELVSNAKSSTLVPYCDFLVRLAIDALNLESSRTVCRSVSLLVRELYSCLLSELDAMTEHMSNRNSGEGESSVPFAVALVSSEEDVLHATIQAFASGSRSTNDPATSARCKEAIMFRKQAEEAGLLSAARLFLSQSKSNNIPNFLNIVQPKDVGGSQIGAIIP